MRIKIKKRHSRGIIRVEGSGEIKEVAIKEDLLQPVKEVVHLFFRGAHSSGIVELTSEEVDMLVKRIHPKTNLSKNVKFLKFEK